MGKRTIVVVAVVAIVLIAAFGREEFSSGSGSGSANPSVHSSSAATPPPASQPAPAAIPPVQGKEVTTASGLKEIDTKVGTGATPQAGQTVEVRYSGWIQEGAKKFESQRTYQFKFGAGQAIKGWEEGLSTMKVGGSRRLIIPPSLAYGATGVPGMIPPNSTLVFDVDLLDLK